jgi:hypothetical protein
VAAVSASPYLHHLLHKDSQSASHQCVFTQIRDHSFVATFATVVAPTPPSLGVASVSPSGIEFAAAFDYLLPPGRAPPAFFSSLV